MDLLVTQEFVIGDGSQFPVRADRSWFAEISNFMRDFIESDPKESIELKDLPNVEIAFYFFKSLNNEWEWLFTDEFDESQLLLIYKSFRVTINYLEMKKKRFKEWIKIACDNNSPHSWRLVFFLAYILGRNPKFEQLIYVKVRLVRKNKYELMTYITKLISILCPIVKEIFYICEILYFKFFNKYTITEKADPRFYEKLSNFVGPGWSWVNHFEEWPQDLLLTGSILGAVMDEKVEQWEGDVIDFVFIPSRSNIDCHEFFVREDKTCSVEGPFKYKQLDLRYFKISKPGSKSILIFILPYFKRPSEHNDFSYSKFREHHCRSGGSKSDYDMVYFNGKELYTTPTAKLNLISRIISLDSLTVTLDKILSAYEYGLEIINYNGIESHLRKMVDRLYQNDALDIMKDVIQQGNRKRLLDLLIEHNSRQSIILRSEDHIEAVNYIRFGVHITNPEEILYWSKCEIPKSFCIE